MTARCILISHDRHMVELTADRLVLVDQRRAPIFGAASTITSISCIGRNSPSRSHATAELGRSVKRGARPQELSQAQESRRRRREAASARLAPRAQLPCARNDAMFDPTSATPNSQRLPSATQPPPAPNYAATSGVPSALLEAASGLEPQAAISPRNAPA
jgi:ATP-binding cassette subfamily F protein 3